MKPTPCRLCGAPLVHSLVDLGVTPLANAYVTAEQAAQGLDQAYPLHARVCSSCLLVQVDEAVPPTAIFSDYAYFSSVSSSWVAHAAQYAAQMQTRLELGPHSLVAEVASNDGYLLQHFQRAGIPVLGIEPAANVAARAQAIGIPTAVEFFNAQSAVGLVERYGQADLVAANNVLAHVPDIRGFVAGFPKLLRPEGVLTFEFPHLLNLIEQVQFDTIYHEHFSYLSLLVVERVLREYGLRVFDVELLPTHGGSLRVFACHFGAAHGAQPALASVREREAGAGLHRPETYAAFAPRVATVIQAFRRFIGAQRQARRTLVAYGAAAKGNTLLNCCGITRDDIVAVADRCPAKQGKLLPGSHIPVVTPEALIALRPDDVVILPWNIADEIAAELQPLSTRGTRLWVATPLLHQISTPVAPLSEAA